MREKSVKSQAREIRARFPYMSEQILCDALRHPEAQATLTGPWGQYEALLWGVPERKVYQDELRRRKERRRSKEFKAEARQRRDAEKRQREVRGIVYVIQAATGGAFKIGVAKNVSKRLATLQTGFPHKLVIVATFPGGRAHERELHVLLADYRLNGEWFREEALPLVMAQKEKVAA